MKNQSISVIGLGYIGLPTAVLMASRNTKVIGVDVNERVVSMVNAGQVHIVEPGLEALLQQVTSAGALRATTHPEPADVFIIAVPTPFRGEHEPDLSFIHSAAKNIAPVLRKGNLIILESTSPVGATEQLSAWLAESRGDLTFPHLAGEDSDIRVAHCPERILPGRALEELVSNDRVVGGLTKRCAEAASALYKQFVNGECILTNARTAELCKLVENSFRDVNIAFANELSVICDKFSIDPWDLIALANRHPRVNILQPGCGVGGHCIAVDPWFIVHGAPNEARLIQCAREVNNHKPKWILENVKKAITTVLSKDPSKKLNDVTVGCLGLAFKPDIDDLRESPALQLTHDIAQIGCRVLAVEPNIVKAPECFIEKNVTLASLDTAILQADIICVLVSHKEFFVASDKIRSCSNIIDMSGIFKN